MRIDCHNHVNGLGYDTKKLIAHYDSLAIDKVWFLTISQVRIVCSANVLERA